MQRYFREQCSRSSTGPFGHGSFHQARVKYPSPRSISGVLCVRKKASSLDRCHEVSDANLCILYIRQGEIDLKHGLHPEAGGHETGSFAWCVSFAMEVHVVAGFRSSGGVFRDLRFLLWKFREFHFPSCFLVVALDDIYDLTNLNSWLT